MYVQIDDAAYVALEHQGALACALRAALTAASTATARHLSVRSVGSARQCFSESEKAASSARTASVSRCVDRLSSLARHVALCALTDLSAVLSAVSSSSLSVRDGSSARRSRSSVTCAAAARELAEAAIRVLSLCSSEHATCTTSNNSRR
eukprot:6188202-Pleurochrysis_carterae.AAC.1